MGGQNMKLRFVDVWAWRDYQGNYVEIAIEEPRQLGLGPSWYNTGSSHIDPDLFWKLTGICTSEDEAMPPREMRIPRWESRNQ